MERNEIDCLTKNGTPNAVSITQFIDGELVSYWVPALDDTLISRGELEKFETYEVALARAVEIKQWANSR